MSDKDDLDDLLAWFLWIDREIIKQDQRNALRSPFVLSAQLIESSDLTIDRRTMIGRNLYHVSSQ